MAILPVSPTDPRNNFFAQVTQDGAMKVSVVPIPLLDTSRDDRLLRRPVTVTFEDDAASTAMNVDGSSVSHSFYVHRNINSAYTFDHLLLYMEDNGGADIHTKQREDFGSAGPLTNGLRMNHIIIGSNPNIILIPRPIRNLKDLMLASDPSKFVNFLKSGPDNDVIIATIPLPYPVALHWTVEESLRVDVRDDLTGISRLEVYAVGYQEFR